MKSSMSAFAALERKLALKNRGIEFNQISQHFEPVQDNELVKPIEPSLEECCGNGCNNCVFVKYATNLAQYEQMLQRLQPKRK